jgi:tetraacyldisaccharide 4'-kinase
MSFKHQELYFLSVIKGEQKGFFAQFLCFFLWLLSGPYRVGVFIRNWMFDHGWLKSFIPPVPLVISIGNITAGGTGKTPVTLMLAEALQKEALLAILSRGYRSQAEKFSSPLLLHKKKGFVHPASLCGDEPYLLAENLPDSLVIVGRNRYQSSKIAARMGAEVLLLDDGMQHRGIARDFEIVVMDIFDPFGCGYFLPRGLLREGASGLARADLIILNHAQDRELFDTVRRKISNVSSAPVMGTCTEVLGVYDLKNRLLSPFQQIKVGIFCGIARPEYFRKTVEKLGMEVVEQVLFPDHDAMDLNRLMDFSKICQKKEASYLLCTEKDRVKLINPSGLYLPIAWVKTRLSILEGIEHWDAFIHQAKNKCQQS